MYKRLKHIVSLVVVGCCLYNISAQTVTLSSEIIWKMKDVYLLDYDTAKVPFIRFNYKNNTADSIYFYNPLKNDNLLKDEGNLSEYLFFIYYPGFLINYGDKFPWDGIMSSFPNWSENEYSVTIAKNDEYLRALAFLVYKNEGINISRENIEASNEHWILESLTGLLNLQLELDRDSTNLQYEYFHHPDKVVSSEKLDDYLSSELDTKDGKIDLKGLFKRDSTRIANKSIYDNCVFLKPYDSFSFEYDLTPFFLLKGSYNFHIQPPQIPESVMRIYDITLPKVHKGYKLFTGQINSVDVMLNIPRQDIVKTKSNDLKQ